MITETLRKLKKESKLTALELSQLSGVPLHTLNKILNGQTTNPKYDTLKAILAALKQKIVFEPIENFSFSQLTSDEISLLQGYRKLTVKGKRLYGHQLTGLIDYEKNHPSQVKQYRELPLYLLPASAGSGMYLDAYNFESTPFLEEKIPNGTKFALKVSGNSMEPFFFQDDIVFVKPALQLSEGDIGIFTVNGEGYIKKYSRSGLLSFNPDYAPIIPGEEDDIRTLGLVIGKYNP